jgi:hypothetical protein
MSSIQFLLASALGLILFLTFANLIVIQYGRGALKSALEQGARVAAVTGSSAGCEQRVKDVVGQLLGGTMGDGVVVSCEVLGGVATVVASAVFDSWTPLSSDFAVELTATATVEAAP